MKIPKVLLVYKDTAYQTHLRLYRGLLKKQNECSVVIRRLKQAHARHFAALAHIEEQLMRRRVFYRKTRRGEKQDFQEYDLVLTVGGDGTFLDTARHLTSQVILGINSDPKRSVGRFCAADKDTFGGLFEQFVSGRARIIAVDRMRMKMRNSRIQAHVLNDVLICHEHPAVMSHYILHLGVIKEEQRSSGIWVSTAAGSTGAVGSAGGKVVSLTSPWFQYHPRELYDGLGEPYRLRGGSFPLNQAMEVSSLMAKGICCLDGSNAVFPFPFCENIILALSPFPLHIIMSSKNNN